MMVQQNRIAIVSTLFFNKSLLLLGLSCYQFLFTNSRITIKLFSSIYIYIYIYAGPTTLIIVSLSSTRLSARNIQLF